MKISFGRAGDRYEREADAVAERVAARQPAPSISRLSPGDLGRGTQRKEDEKEHVQRQRRKDEEERIQLRSQERTTPAMADAAARVIRSRGPGTSMHPGVRRRLEHSMGIGLQGVRVHQDGPAQAAAASLHARAFTHGNHIWLGRGESQHDVRLMAHEAAHVVQQGAAPDPAGSAPGVVQHADGPAVVQRFGWGDVASALGGAWDATAGAIVDAAGDVIEWVGEKAWAAVEKMLPERIVHLIREISEKGIFDFLLDKLKAGFSSIFDGLLDRSSLLTSAVETFKAMRQRAGIILAALASGNCEPLFQAIRDFTDLMGEVASDVWEEITAFLEPIGDWLSDMWQKFGAPLVDWIENVAGGVWAGIKSIWDGIKELAADLWEATEPIRDTLGEGWEWIKEQLGFGGESSAEGRGAEGGGLIGWIKDKVGDAWDAVTDALQPIIDPIKQVVDKVVDLLPLDAIRDMQARAEQWHAHTAALGGNAGQPRDVVENRDLLREVILPAVLGAIATLRQGVATAEGWIVGAVEGLVAPIRSFLSGLADIDFLSGVRGALQWVQDGVNTLVTWAQDTVRGLFGLVDRGLQKLADFAEPVLTTLRRIVGVVVDAVSNLPDLVLGPFWRLIPGCLRDVIKDFVVEHILSHIPFFSTLVQVPDLWEQIVGVARRVLLQIFVEGDLLGALWTLFKAILRMVNIPPSLVTQIVARALQAFADIMSDPLGFLGNVLRAMWLGFSQFFSNILSHLMSGISEWLFGKMSEAGIEPPQDLSLASLLGVMLQVLGITVDRILDRLAEKLNLPRARVDRLVERVRRMASVAGTALEWIQILVEEGPGALWEKLRDRLSELGSRLLEGVVGWVNERIITQASRWLLSLLDVTGIMPIINAIIALYRAVQSFFAHLREMLEIVNSTLKGLISIARGVLGQAANILENTLSRSIPIAIGFLANQFGFSNLSSRLQEIIGTIRGYVDRAIDWLIDRALGAVRAIMRGVRRGVGAVREGATAEIAEQDPRKAAKIQAGLAAIDRKERTVVENGTIAHEEAVRIANQVQREHPVFRSIAVVSGDGTWDYRYAASPAKTKQGEEKEEEVVSESSLSIWETVASETMEDYLNNFQNWRQPRPGTELGQTRAVPVRLADISVRRAQTAVKNFINNSPATQAEKSDALNFALQKISEAAASQEEATIYRRLRSAASRIQRLYGGRASFPLDVEHLTEVAQNPDLFPRTRISRRYAAVAARIRSGSVRPGSPETEIVAMSTTPAQKRSVARLYAEQIIDDSLGDVGEVLDVDAPVEIELEIITQATHQAITARRAAERAGK